MTANDEGARARARAAHAQLIATITRAIATRVCPKCGAASFHGSVNFNEMDMR